MLARVATAGNWTLSDHPLMHKGAWQLGFFFFPPPRGFFLEYFLILRSSFLRPDL